MGGRSEVYFSLTRLLAGKGRGPSVCVHVQIIFPGPELKYGIHPRLSKTRKRRDFPGGTVVKNLPANAGDTGSSPGPGRSHMPWSN